MRQPSNLKCYEEADIAQTPCVVTLFKMRITNWRPRLAHHQFRAIAVSYAIQSTEFQRLCRRLRMR
jgi:hypothetical protein